jgi:putative DNA primase/helicase
MTDPFDDFSKAEGLDSNTRTERDIFPPLSDRPAYVCYDEDFVVNDTKHKAGVYLHGSREEKNEEGETVEQPVDLWICSPLKVLCIVRAASGNEHSYLVEYVEHGEETPRRTLLSQALLLGRPEEALKVLRDLGVSVLYKNLKLVREYLDKQHLRFSARWPNYFWRSSKVVGWAPAPDCFVLPKEILSNNGEPARVWFDGKCDLYTKDGTLEEWKTNVAALCVGNPFLIFAVSAAFSGPLLELCGVPGIGFHFYGDSSNGKTTALVAGSSVWGLPRSFVLSWRSTANGLESQAVIRSSIMIALDESHLADPKTLDNAVYLLANGVAKSRMTREIAARAVARWWASVLSCGERSIESHLGAGKVDHKAGQGIRLADIPVRGNFGLFDDLHGRKDGAAFSDEIRNAAAKYYGHAGPLFVQRLINAGPAGVAQGSALAVLLSRFGDDLSAQEQRVARSFALVALAGELATSGKIVPWQGGDATSAALEIFNLWRAAQPRSAQGKEHAQIVERILDFIDKHGNARFCDIETPGIDLRLLHDQAGYWEDCPDGRDYLFTPGGLKEAVGNFGIARVVAAIEAAGALTQTGDHGKKAKVRRVPEGGTKRLYHIDVEKLREDLT